MGYRSSWKSRGIKALCLIVGLLVGFGAGFLIQRELRHTKAVTSSTRHKTTSHKPSSTSPAKATSSSTAPATASKGTISSSPALPASSATAPAPPAQGPIAASPAKAMTAYLQSKGLDGTNISFSVVSLSKSNPGWKVDKGTKANIAPSYFLLHSVPGGWTVVDYGPGFTAAQMTADGAPADLAPTPTSAGVKSQ